MNTETELVVPAQLPGAGALTALDPRIHAHLDKPRVLSLTPNLPGMLQALRRRWGLAFFLGLVFAGGAAAAAWFSLPERFTARTLVHLAPPDPIIPVPGTRVDAVNYQRTQIAFIKSRLVLNAALRDPKVVLASKTIKEEIDPVLWVESQIQADFSVSPEILRIQMTGEKPAELTAIVNAVRDAYLKDNADKENKQRNNRLSKLREIHADYEKKLLESRGTLSSMAEELGSTKDSKAMERTQELAWKTLDNVLNELVQTQNKLRRAQIELTIKKQQEDKGKEAAVPAEFVETSVKNDKIVAGYQKQLAGYQIKIEQLKATSNDIEKEPRYKQWLAESADVQKQLDAYRAELRGRVSKVMKEKMQAEAEAASAALQKEINILQQQDELLSQEVKKRTDSLKTINKNRIGVEWLRDDISAMDDLVRKMRSQINVQEVELQAPARFAIMEETNVAPNKDSRLKMSGMAGVGVFALVVLGICFLEFRRLRVNSIDDVVTGLRMRLVGALPTMPRQRRRLADRQHEMLESVDAARTMLIHAAQTESLRLIVVTSAVGGEGKTLTSSHLAASVARAGRKCLLIDADLRRPALHDLFNLNGQPGFSELLRGEADLHASVQAGPVPGFSVMTAGSSDDFAIQALSQPILKDIFRLVKEQFDFIIVDSAPVLPVADTQLISQQADGVLFSVLQDVSRLPQVYSARERLMMLGIPVLGVVVHGGTNSSYGVNYYSAQTFSAAEA